MRSPAEKEPEAKKAAAELFEACIGDTDTDFFRLNLNRVLDIVRSEVDKRKDEFGTFKAGGIDDVMFNYTMKWLIECYGLETVLKAAENWPIPEIERTPAGSA